MQNHDSKTACLYPNLFFGFTTALVLVVFTVPVQKSHAQSIFDLVTKAKSTSKTQSTPSGSTEPSSSQASSSYPSNLPSGTANPSSNFPGNSPANPSYSSGGSVETVYPANQAASGSAGVNTLGGQATSGLQNAVNRGIQNNLQKGFDRGVGTLDRFGRRVGVPGLGSLLSSPNSRTYPRGAYSPANPYAAPATQSPTATYSPQAQAPSADEMPYRRHVNPSSYSTAKSTTGKEAYDAVSRRARQSQADAYIRSAQQAEARRDWNQAAFAYRQAAGGDDITQEDSDAAARNHTSAVDEMLKRKFRDPSVRQLNMKWAYCAAQLLNQDYAGQNTGVDAKHTEGELFAAFESLEDSDKGNAAWPYLCAVYWCSENLTNEWNYIKAWNKLLDALKCQRITPSIREKCLALQKHIQPAKELQVNDMKRAVFAMEQDLVWNVEHPHVAGTEYRESRVQIDATHERVTTYSRQYMNTELWAVETYDDCKRHLREKYPAFKTEWLKQLNQMMSLPNQGMSAPPGPANEEPALYCPARWEQLAFGPLDLTIGREYPKRTSSGHHDPDCMPRAYTSRFNMKLKGK